MAATFRIDSGQGVIFSRLEGEITLATLRDYTQSLHADPDYRAGLVQLVEVHSIRMRVNFNEMYAYVRGASGLVPIQRTAIVADDAQAFGMARMFEQLSQESATEVEVFRDLASARAWLGLTE